MKKSKNRLQVRIASGDGKGCQSYVRTVQRSFFDISLPDLAVYILSQTTVKSQAHYNVYGERTVTRQKQKKTITNVFILACYRGLKRVSRN